MLTDFANLTVNLERQEIKLRRPPSIDYLAVGFIAIEMIGVSKLSAVRFGITVSRRYNFARSLQYLFGLRRG